MDPASDLFLATDPATLAGIVDPQRLLAAAAVFPGGAVVLVFMLFWAPVGPGIPAGVLLARVAGINPAATFALYALSDVLGACVCHPIYSLLRRLAAHVPAVRPLGRKLLKLALIGTPAPRPGDAARTFPALFRIGAVGFGADIYTAGLLIAGLPVPRVPGWASAIVGDLIWFTILLATSIATAQVTDRSWVQLVVMIVVMAVVPRVARRFVPALREAPVQAG
jgi:hypothetical protein